MNKLEAELRKSIEQQDYIIETLKDYIYTLESDLEFAKHNISLLKGELSVLHNKVDRDFN